VLDRRLVHVEGDVLAGGRDLNMLARSQRPVQYAGASGQAVEAGRASTIVRVSAGQAGPAWTPSYRACPSRG